MTLPDSAEWERDKEILRQEIRVRKEAEEKLLAAEARYRALVEQLPAIIYTIAINPAYTPNYISPQVKAIFGYSPNDWVNSQTLWVRLLHPDDRQRVVQAVREHLRQGQPLNIEYRARTRAGQLLWFRNQSTIVRDETGQPILAHGVMFDITEQKLFEQALTRSETRNRALLDAIPDLMFLFNREGVFLESKVTGANLLLRPEEFLGRKVTDVLPPELAINSLRNIEEALRTERVCVYEYTLPAAETVRHFEARYVASGPDEVLAIVRDITERKRAEAELARAKEEADAANRAKSAFLANMSHELRTPLNAIIGYSEMLTEEMREQDQALYAGDLLKVTTAGKHLLTLINDILDLSKIEAGKMPLIIETFDILESLNQVVAVAKPLAEKNNNVLQVHCEPAIGQMTADETKVRQALSNLLGNACKFTENGFVWLQTEAETTPEQDWIIFRVTDTGIGLAADQLEQLFQDFTQADPSSTRKYGGTGLGLAITRRFCQMMGGEVLVQSELDKGSTFTIRLPREVPITSH